MLLVLVLGISASFAADTNQTDLQASDDTDTVVSITETDTVSSNDDEVYSAGNDSDVLSATAGSFTELSTLINSSTTGSITLEKDYIYDSATDGAFVNGITIDRTISIDGAGKAINGNNAARIFNVYGNNVLIRDVNFINGYTTGNTGAVNWYGANGYLVSSLFQDNVAKNYGALYWSGTSGTISGCTFTQNHATANYGAAFIDVIEAKMNGCTFNNNYAVNYGALGINKAYVTVSECTFNSNYATSSTGAVYWASAEDGNLNNCLFVGNHAQTNGALLFSSSKGTVDKCTFDNNYATANVGGAQCNGGNMLLKNSVFNNNHANNGYGGGLFYNTVSAIRNCTFENNTATTNGGGLYATGNMNSYDCKYVNNSAVSGGGYYNLASDASRCVDSIFINNHATNGGAIVARNVIGSYFEENDATNGGAVYITSGPFNLINNKYIKNTATHGGAIYSTNKGYIGNSTFESNSALNNGGAIFSSGDYLSVVDSKFTSNSAGNLGGAVYGTGNYFSIINCEFDKNTALFNSGAIYIQSGKSVSLDYTLKSSSDTVNATGITQMPSVLYVSPTGLSTNDGSINSPLNWASAFTKIANGGTIYVKEGTYTGLTATNTNNKNVKIIGLGSVTLDLNQLNAVFLTLQAPMCLVQNIKFKNGKPTTVVLTGNGGAYCHILNCTFENGGPLDTGGRYWTTENCIFKNNSWLSGSGEGGAGGALRMSYQAQTLINCTFIGNTAINGGAIQLRGLECYIIDCKFINNTATNRGGAIYVTNYLANFTNCEFIGNDAVEGGAIFFESGGNDASITGATFTNNSATKSGGAIYSNALRIYIDDSEFSGNTASDNGGALYSAGRQIIVSNSKFNDNGASNGGAVYSTGANGNVADSNFTGNGASDEGGAIYSTGTGATVSGSNFGENSATNGSAVMVGENTDITIEGSDFSNNTGNGSVYVPEGSNFVIDSETTFENNTGGDLETPGVVSAKVLYVNVTATGDGLLATGPTNWEQGFANVQNEGILYVLPGTYDMSQLSPIIVDKSLSIIGVGEGVIFTNGARGTLFDIQSNNVKLSNIKFNAISGDYIKWDGTNGEIESCTFDGQGTNSNNKLITTTVGSTNFKITNTNFTNLKYGNLIYATNYLTTVENAIFKSNTQYNSNSILIDDVGSDFSIVNSKFESNTGKLVQFESNANRGAITGTTFTSNTVGSSNSMIYINSKSSTVSSSTFKNSNTGGTYKYIYGTESFALSGNTFEGVTASLNSVSGVTYPNNPTVSGTFNYGVNRANTIPVTANSNLLPNVARSGDATTFSYSWDTPLPDTYTLTFATTDSEGNKYTYTSTPNSVSTTVNRISTVYISPAGTGTGASASDPTKWDNVANVLTDTGSVVFTAGTYKLNGKTISKSWKLSNSGNVIIDAENKGRIFTINANNVEITGITFKNGEVSGNQGSAISWTGTGGKITNSIFNENTGVPISSANDLTITNTQMKNQISLTKSNINWGATETIKATFSHSAPSTVTVMFNGNSQGSYAVSSKVATAAVAFTNPSTQAVGSYVVTDQKNIYKEVL